MPCCYKAYYATQECRILFFSVIVRSVLHLRGRNGRRTSGFVANPGKKSSRTKRTIPGGGQTRMPTLHEYNMSRTEQKSATVAIERERERKGENSLVARGQVRFTRFEQLILLPVYTPRVLPLSGEKINK